MSDNYEALEANVKQKTLKVLREKLEENQTDFGKRFWVTRKTVSRWERRVKKPQLTLKQVKVLNELLALTELAIDDLYEEE